MQSGREPAKVIVAHGQPGQAEAVASFLAARGFETVALSDGSDAILAAEMWPADGAVLSIPLASVSGLDVARHLRQSFGPSFRLVACSPGADRAPMTSLAAAGFDQVVESPEPRSILAALGEATRLLVIRSMQQTVRRIELLVVLGHSLLGSRQEQASAVNLQRASRIAELVAEDIARIELPKERARLTRELKALAERLPGPREMQS